MGDDFAGCKVDHRDCRPRHGGDVDGEPVSVERNAADISAERRGEFDIPRLAFGQSRRARHRRVLNRARGLIDNRREHEGEAGDEQDSHRDHSMFEKPDLTGREDRSGNRALAFFGHRQTLMSVPTKRLTAEADESHKGQRLDRFLSERLPELSRTRLQALIREGRVALGLRTIEDVKYPVKPGDRFDIAIPAPAPATPAAQELPLNIVYEDDAIVVLDKPAGLVVHPGAGNADRTLVNALIAHCGESLSGIGGVARPGIVHRLDKDTSGLMVVAKTDEAHHSLSEQFADHGREGELERTYVALVWSAPPRRSGSIDAPIGRHPTSRIKMGIVPVAKGGREATTHYRVLQSFGGGREQTPTASLLECSLETGRTHQVRVHLSSIGTPLIGDPVYGQGFKSKIRTLPEGAQGKFASFRRQALHAASLSFLHPLTGTLLKFNSTPPRDFASLLRALKEL